MNIAILGAGAWGTALGMVLHENGHSVRVWGNDPARISEVQRTRRNEPALVGIEIPSAITFTADLDVASAGADILLFVTPSKAIRATASLPPRRASNSRLG
jgi:glycerol-3-phosphate dehydrogenase (NAD(P)+)